MKKKRITKADPDGVERRRQQVLALYSSGLGIHRVAIQAKTSQRMVRKILDENGVDRRKQSEAQSADRNWAWTGGRKLDDDGYVMIYIGKRKYVREHRLVMEAMIGRKLLSTEVVHHIDGNKQNNTPANLQLFSSNSEHLAHELKGRVPKWTEDGLRRMKKGVESSLQTRRSRLSKNDARE